MHDFYILWVELYLSERYAEVLIPGTCECTLFGDRIFAYSVKMKMKIKSYWSMLKFQSNMTSILIREKQRGRLRQIFEWCINKPRNDKDCRLSPEAGKKSGTDSPSELSEGNNPADYLISGSYPPNCETLHFCCFKPPVCCGTYHSSPRNQCIMWPGNMTIPENFMSNAINSNTI